MIADISWKMKYQLDEAVYACSWISCQMWSLDDLNRRQLNNAYKKRADRFSGLTLNDPLHFKLEQCTRYYIRGTPTLVAAF